MRISRILLILALAAFVVVPASSAATIYVARGAKAADVSPTYYSELPPYHQTYCSKSLPSAGNCATIEVTGSVNCYDDWWYEQWRCDVWVDIQGTVSGVAVCGQISLYYASSERCVFTGVDTIPASGFYNVHWPGNVGETVVYSGSVCIEDLGGYLYHECGTPIQYPVYLPPRPTSPDAGGAANVLVQYSVSGALSLLTAIPS